HRAQNQPRGSVEQQDACATTTASNSLTFISKASRAGDQRPSRSAKTRREGLRRTSRRRPILSTVHTGTVGLRSRLTKSYCKIRRSLHRQRRPNCVSAPDAESAGLRLGGLPHPPTLGRSALLPDEFDGKRLAGRALATNTAYCTNE